MGGDFFRVTDEAVVGGGGGETEERAWEEEREQPLLLHTALRSRHDIGGQDDQRTKPC